MAGARGFNHNQRWQSPTLGMALPFDIAMTVVLVVVLLAPMLLTQIKNLGFQAKLTEALLAGSNVRLAVIESFAISGDAFEAPGVTTSVALPTTAAEHLAGTARMNRPTPPAGEPRMRPAELGRTAIEAAQAANQERASLREANAGGGETKYVKAVRTQGASIVVSGRIEGYDDADYELALTPAVRDGAVPRVVVWQCGRNRLPDGWTGPTPELSRRLPPDYLPSMCGDKVPDR